MLRPGSAVAAVALPLAVSAATSLSALRLPGGEVRIEYRLPEGMPSAHAALYRSHLDLSEMGALDIHAKPISRFDLGEVPARGSWTDSLHADGIAYWYYLQVKGSDGQVLAGPAARVEIPPRALEAGACDGGCALLVDKERYILEVWRGGKVLKRYPIGLGSNPVDRKLHQDNRTTPEGSYRIEYLKPRSQFHRAYGIDYPNAADRARYQRARRQGTLPRDEDGVPDIGGAMQIHGGGTWSNWTWGCMAMSNDDIDELFAQPGLRAGTPVHIAGKEIKRGDLESRLRTPAGRPPSGRADRDLPPASRMSGVPEADSRSP